MIQAELKREPQTIDLKAASHTFGPPADIISIMLLLWMHLTTEKSMRGTYGTYCVVTAVKFSAGLPGQIS